MLQSFHYREHDWFFPFALLTKKLQKTTQLFGKRCKPKLESRFSQFLLKTV